MIKIACWIGMVPDLFVAVAEHINIQVLMKQMHHTFIKHPDDGNNYWNFSVNSISTTAEINAQLIS